MILQNVLTFSLILTSGFLPALLWLWLILKEDREHPEPRMRLILSFLGGMAAVIAVIPVQKVLSDLFPQSMILTIALATTEEIAKLFFAFYFALRTRDTDEPVDEVIYMITTALGFAALENSLFLTAPFMNGNLLGGILIANARFIGSTLVHVVSSGIVGLYLAHVFNNPNKKTAIASGIVLAAALHATYNLLIIQNNSGNIATAFSGLWLISIALIYVLNHVKHTVYKEQPSKIII